MADGGLDLYEFPPDHVGRKSYVSVRGHSRSIPKYKTYRGAGGYNYLLPEHGGDWSGMTNGSVYLVPDKAGYLSPMDGKYVEGRHAHRDHMKRHNVLEAGDMKLGEYANRERPTAGGTKDDIRRSIKPAWASA
jgi:hypothetical protein